MGSADGLVRLAVAAACVFVTACYHWAELTTTWGGNGMTPRTVPFQHVLTAFVTTDPTLRRRVEDRLVALYARSEASYFTLATVDLADSTAVRRALAAGNFDSAIIMSIVQTDGRRSWSPGAPIHSSPAPPFMEEWVRVWGFPFDPASLPPKRGIAVELRVYSLDDERLIWAGRGDPGDARTVFSLADEAMRHLPSELEREGLIAQEAGTVPIGPTSHRY
jgi:hypothetical protein